MKLGAAAVEHPFAKALSDIVYPIRTVRSYCSSYPAAAPLPNNPEKIAAPAPPANEPPMAPAN